VPSVAAHVGDVRGAGIRKAGSLSDTGAGRRPVLGAEVGGLARAWLGHAHRPAGEKPADSTGPGAVPLLALC
jgi:hypothetical protein